MLALKFVNPQIKDMASTKKVFRNYIKKKYGIKLSSKQFNIVVGFVVLSLIFWYYYILPLIIGTWKLWHIDNKIDIIEIGEDTYEPLDGSVERIPAIIHHMAPNEQSLPAEWQMSHDSCLGVHQRFKIADDPKLNNNPDNSKNKYIFKLWHDDDMRRLVASEYEWFLETYDTYTQNIQRVDSLKYFILRKYGGIYVDLDVGCKRSLDNLRRMPEKGMILPDLGYMGVGNDIMIAAPEHPFMIYVTEQLKEYAINRWYSDYYTVLLSTGRYFLSIAAYNFAKEAPQLTKDIGLLNYDDYNNEVLFHMSGSSWLHSDGYIILFIVDTLPFMIFLFVAISCCYKYQNNVNSNLNKLTKKINMKNVNTVSELVHVVKETTRDRVKEYTDIVKLPDFENVRIVRESIQDVFSNRKKTKKNQKDLIIPAKAASKWRYGEKKHDIYGNSVPNTPRISGDDYSVDANSGLRRQTSGSDSDSDGMIYPMWANDDIYSEYDENVPLV